MLFRSFSIFCARHLHLSAYSAPLKNHCICSQITGDPNVPAGKVSFCVSAENARMGTYNGFEREELEPGVFDDVLRDIGAASALCTSCAGVCSSSLSLPCHTA